MKLPQRWMSIDPGQKGGIVIWEEGVPLGAMAMPMIGSDVDIVTICEMLEHMTTVVLEKVGGMPGQSAPAAFKFGRDVGCIIGATIAEKCRLEFVAPNVWTKIFHAGIPVKTAPKDRSRMAAQRLYPSMVSQLKPKGCRVMQDGMCDALGIGHAWIKKQ
jgi:hypothetical protein